MGASWRIGVDRTERIDLATRGLYRHARNPIYSGMRLVWTAEALLVPNARPRLEPLDPAPNRRALRLRYAGA